MKLAHELGMNARYSCRAKRVCKLLFGGVAAASLSLTTPSRADDANKPAPAPREREGKSKTHIAVDFDFSSALDALGAKLGGGGALRIGQKYRVPLLSLTPELGGSYHAFGGNDETRTYRGFVGGRLGVGTVIEPSVFAHLGIGHLEGLQTRTQAMLDGGLALDITLIPLLDFGVHGGYNVMLPKGDAHAFKYLTLGVQVALVL